jgi:hypothetical protein
VESCPPGKKKVISWSSPECGAYYACKAEDTPEETTISTTAYCGDGTCDPDESKTSCPVDCGYEKPDWTAHTWIFSDGQTEISQILDRDDAEYLGYIANVETECRKIRHDQFRWKQNAGDDSPDNWRNFGIPDCSAVDTAHVCGNGTCDPGETPESCADCGRADTDFSNCSSQTTESQCRAVSDCWWYEQPGGFFHCSDVPPPAPSPGTEEGDTGQQGVGSDEDMQQAKDLIDQINSSTDDIDKLSDSADDFGTAPDL